MGLALLAVWMLGIVIWFTDGKRPSTRWASATAFIGGFGFLSGVVDEVWRPTLRESGFYSPSIDQLLGQLEQIASFICQAGLPYAFLMFAFYSSPRYPLHWKRRASFLGFIPVIITWLITPILPELQFDYRWMVSWAVPYIFYGSYLLIMLFMNEKDPLMKQSHFITIVLSVIPLLFVMVTIYILRTIHLHEVWKANIWIISAQFILFLIFSLKYGVLGVKLRVERHRLDTTMRVLTSGTDILNHSIKNEVGKIQLFASRLENYADDSKKPHLKEDVQVIFDSTDHLLRMVQRIQAKMKDLTLEEEICSMRDIINRSIQQVNPILDSKKITLSMPNDEINFTIRADAVHLHEVFTNLFMNAIEALPVAGNIKLDLYESKKYVVVSIEDNGSGIAKENLPFILDPFFSTKKNSASNFGLGLSYCYNVMRKHEGLLEVHSIKGEGTTVFLYFPKRRWIR